MAISSYKIYLMKKDGSTYEKLVDIKDFPDLGGTPEMIEVTTLSDKMQRYILGIKGSDGLEFTANYDLTKFKALKLLSGQQTYAVWMGAANGVLPDGLFGKFEFTGELSVYVAGAGVNDVVEMKITIAPSSGITKTS